MKHTKLWRTIVTITLLLLSLLLLISCQTNAKNETTDGAVDEPGNDPTSDPTGKEPSDTPCEHEMVAVFAQSPTCSKIGWSDYEACSLCGYMTREEIPALGHDYVDGVCSRCTAIPVSDHLKFYPSYDGTCTVHCSGNCSDREVVIPHISPDGYKVTGISFSHYTCKGFEKLTFHEDCAITEIGERAFYRMDTLKSIELPASVTSIGKEAFSGCDALESVTFAEGGTLTSLGSKAFYQCKNLQTIEWNDVCQLTEIGEETFKGCESLEKIDLPETLTRIAGNAFHGCGSLTFVDIPASVTAIDAGAFSECGALTRVSFAKESRLDTLGGGAFGSCDAFQHFEIPSSVSFVGASAVDDRLCELVDGIYYLGDWALGFDYELKTIRLRKGTVGVASYAFNLDSYERIVIPESLRYVDESSFYADTALVSIVVDEENPVFHSAGNCLIETDTKTLVMGCKSSVIPSDGSVTIIGSDAFLFCHSLTEIDLPDCIERIEDGAFSFTGIKEVRIPSSVKYIGDAAFGHCDALTQITLEDGVIEIANHAFIDNPGLKNVTIPASVERMAASAFSNCENLQKVVFEETKGWYQPAEDAYTKDKPIDVSDPAVNAETMRPYRLGTTQWVRT